MFDCCVAVLSSLSAIVCLCAVVCCVSFAVRWFIVCCLMFVVRWLLRVGCLLFIADFHVSFVVPVVGHLLMFAVAVVACCCSCVVVCCLLFVV